MNFTLLLHVFLFFTLENRISFESKAYSANQGQFKLDFKSDEEIQILNPEILEDPNWKIDIDNAPLVEGGTWKQFNKPNIGYSKSRYWIRFKVMNLDKIKRNFILEEKYPLLKKISFYLLKDNRVILKSIGGRELPFDQRFLNYRTFTFPFSLEGLEPNAWIYIEVSSGGTIQCLLKLYSPELFATSTAESNLFLGLYYGTLFSMILYNLFLFFGTRDLTYLLYVVYVSFYFLFQAALDGTTYQYLWPNCSSWNFKTVPFFGFSSLVFLIAFTKKFLIIKNKKLATSNLLNVALVFCLVLSLCGVFTYDITINKITSITYVVVPVIILIHSLICFRENVSQSTYFIFAFFLLILGNIAVSMRDLSFFSINFMTRFGMQVGSSAEVILLSLALANRIRNLREDKISADLRATLSSRALKIRSEAFLESERMAQIANQAAHDIRSPLTALNVVLSIAENLPEHNRGIATTALARIQEIANDLLIKIKAPYELKNFVSLKRPRKIQSIFSILKSLVSEIKLQYSENEKISILFSVEPESEDFYSDIHASSLKRIISNIVNNSAEAILEQGGKILIQLKSDEAFNIISVVDNGPGMSEAVLENIGKCRMISDKKNSNGMGLIYVFEAVSEFDGSIKINSDSNNGTSVQLRFPKVNFQPTY